MFSCTLLLRNPFSTYMTEDGRGVPNFGFFPFCWSLSQIRQSLLSSTIPTAHKLLSPGFLMDKGKQINLYSNIFLFLYKVSLFFRWSSMNYWPQMEAWIRNNPWCKCAKSSRFYWGNKMSLRLLGMVCSYQSLLQSVIKSPNLRP